jgi:hypothetical protein
MKRFALISLTVLALAWPSQGIFQLSLGTGGFSDPHLIDFGSVNIGDSYYGVPPDNLIITCKSDQGNPWYLQMRAQSDLQMGMYTIPIENMKFFGTYAGPLTMPNASERFFQRQAISLRYTDVLLYRSDSSGDATLSESDIYVQFGITVPQTMPVGYYTTTIIITMTE